MCYVVIKVIFVFFPYYKAVYSSYPSRFSELIHCFSKSSYTENEFYRQFKYSGTSILKSVRSQAYSSVLQGIVKYRLKRSIFLDIQAKHSDYPDTLFYQTTKINSP